MLKNDEKEGGGDSLPKSFQELREYFKYSSIPLPVPGSTNGSLLVPASDMALPAKSACSHWHLQGHEAYKETLEQFLWQTDISQ